jgi:hypothetical protein
MDNLKRHADQLYTWAAVTMAGGGWLLAFVVIVNR